MSAGPPSSGVALDTNILAYMVGVDRGPTDGSKVVQARQLVSALSGHCAIFVSSQALAELYALLTRVGWRRDLAKDDILTIASRLVPLPTSIDTFHAALDLAAAHHFQIWDAIILTAAAEAGCAWLVSEDMQDGFAWRGVRIVNPFATPLHRQFADLIAP